MGINLKLDLLPSKSKELSADLFNEELGVVIQVAKKDKEMVMEELGSCSLRKHVYPFAELNQEKVIKCLENGLNKKAFSYARISLY